jgi:hypothetical protein
VDPTETGACEECGQPFTSTRNAYSLRYAKVAPKRFCGETCRKRAESRRWRQRHAEAR